MTQTGYDSLHQEIEESILFQVATVIAKLRPKIHVQTSVAKAFDAAGVQFKTVGHCHCHYHSSHSSTETSILVE